MKTREPTGEHDDWITDGHRSVSESGCSHQTPSQSVVEFRGSLYEACGVREDASGYASRRSASRRKLALTGSAVALTLLLGVILLARSSPPVGVSVLAVEKLQVEQLKSVEFFNLSDDPQVTSKDANWGYDGSIGPSNWGTLSALWGVCGTGKMQSPININRKTVQEFKMAPLKWEGFEKGTETGSETAKEFYDGKTIALGDLHGPEIEVLGFSRYLKDLPLSAVNKNHFMLKEIRIHTPSEHSIDDKRFDAEIQLMHECNSKTTPACPQSKTMVVSILMAKARAELDEHSPAFLETLIDDIELLGGVWSQYVSLYSFDFGGIVAALKPYVSRYFFFKGSLTAPPCTEDVTWLVLKDPMPIAQEHLDFFLKVQDMGVLVWGGGARVLVLTLALACNYQGKNSRPLQPANDRVVFSI